MRNVKKTTLVVALLGWVYSLSAQVPSELKQEYAEERFVRLESFRTVKMSVEDEGLAILENNRSVSYLAGKALNGNGEVSISYEAPFTEIVDMDAYTLVPKEGKDKYSRRKVKSKTVEDKKVLDNSVFHNGTRSKTFTFPEARKGAITVLDYTEAVYEPHLLGRSIFASRYYTQHQKFELIFDKEIDIDIQYINCDSSDFTITRHSNRKQNEWRWEQKEREAMESEGRSPSYLSVAPHILYRIKSYGSEEGSKPVLRDVSDLYAWYREFIKDVQKQAISPQLRNITDSLVQFKNSEYEKAKAIYDWVSHSIRYIAVEDGLGGFVPRSANMVCNKRYGDCKDMSNIMVDMMQHAGLKAHHVWIGTRDIPYSLHTTPTALAHNHMIASLDLNGKNYFLDATNKNLSFPYPSEFTQAKEGLIAIDEENYKIQEVPVMPAHFNWDVDSIDLRLSGKSLQGIGRNWLYGYEAQEMAYRYDKYDKSDLNKYMENYYSRGNNRCKSELINHQRNDSALGMTYTFKVPEYAYTNGNETYLNLNLEKTYSSLRLEEDRELPMELDRTQTTERHYVLHLPEGRNVKYLPEAMQVDYGDFGFESQYSQKDSTVNYHLKVTLNTLLVKPEKFEDWNAFIDQLKQVYNQSIVIH